MHFLNRFHILLPAITLKGHTVYATVTCYCGISNDINKQFAFKCAQGKKVMRTFLFMCRPLVLVPNKHKESEKQSVFCRPAHRIKYLMNQALHRRNIKFWELEIQEKAPERSQIEQLL